MPRLETLIGFVLALLLLCGRWTPSRLVNEADSDVFFLEPRFWAVVALVLLAAACVAQRTGRNSSLGWVPLLIGALLGYLLLSARWAPVPEMASEKAYEILLILVAALCLFACLQRADPQLLRAQFWKGLVLITGAMAVLALVGGASGRSTVLGGGPNIFGRNMGLLVFGSLFLLRQGPRKWAWAFTGVAVVAFLLVVMSGSRGALAATAAAGAAFMIADRTTLSRKVVLCISLGLAGFVLLNATTVGRDAQRVFTQRVLLLTFEMQYSSGREDLYYDAYELGRDYPYFGYGLNGFRAVVGTYPHNVVLELFSEGGLVALSLFALMLACAAFRLRKLSGINAATVAALVHLLIACQFSGDMYDSRGIFLMLPLVVVPETLRQAGGIPPARPLLAMRSPSVAR